MTPAEKTFKYLSDDVFKGCFNCANEDPDELTQCLIGKGDECFCWTKLSVAKEMNYKKTPMYWKRK